MINPFSKSASVLLIKTRISFFNEHKIFQNTAKTRYRIAGECGGENRRRDGMSVVTSAVMAQESGSRAPAEPVHDRKGSTESLIRASGNRAQ